MASAIVGVHSCGNWHHFLVLGALGPSPSPRGGLQAPFLFDLRVAGMADSTIQQAWTPPISQHLVTRNFPVQIQLPWPGAQPTGTDRCIATRLLRSPCHSHVGCRDRGLGSWRCPSPLPLGEAQAPQARGRQALHRPTGYSTVADAVIEALKRSSKLCLPP
jgi:hypothetical protein